MKSKRAGSTLVTVLLCLVALGLLTMAMASSMLANYNLAVRYRDSTQADWLARAGVQEFIYRAEQFQAQALPTEPPQALLPRFQGQEVLLRPSERIPAQVSLVLEGVHASRDNTLSDRPAASSFDGPSQTSVPPFSLDLVLKVEWGGRSFLYEALLQQRWPYAVAAPGPIVLMGQMGGDGLNGAFRSASTIEGNVLAMRSGCLANPFPVEMALHEKETYAMLAAFSQADGEVTVFSQGARVRIGGDMLVYRLLHTNVGGEFPIVRTTLSAGAPVATVGAHLKGGVDLYENGQTLGSEPRVSVHARSTHVGEVRSNYRLGGLDPQHNLARQRLDSLLKPPDLDSSWIDISAHCPAEPATDVIITSRPSRTATSGQVVIQVPSGKAWLRRSLTMRPGRKLEVEDCALAVRGNLTCGSTSGSSPTRALTGSNATLIVLGMLWIDDGELDAGGNGMVIHSDYFFIKAVGQYRGLIIGRRGGAFFGIPDEGRFSGPPGQVAQPNPEPDLVIRGGVILGDNAVQIYVPETRDSSTGALVGFGMPPLALKSLALTSTRIIYDPLYLRGLNQFGRFHLQGLLRR